MPSPDHPFSSHTGGTSPAIPETIRYVVPSKLHDAAGSVGAVVVVVAVHAPARARAVSIEIRITPM
jgi:2-methylaconitate cis-trans-isomerase PrpF